MVNAVVDGWKRRTNAAIIRDILVYIHRDIKINTDQNPLAGDIDLLEALDPGHIGDISCHARYLSYILT